MATRPEPPKRREIVIVRQCEQCQTARACMPRIARAPVALWLVPLERQDAHATHEG